MEIGLTPKEFCRIEKLNYFIRTYKQESEGTLTELTYKCGYYDQSHLIKYFLNTSPRDTLFDVVKNCKKTTLKGKGNS